MIKKAFYKTWLEAGFPAFRAGNNKGMVTAPFLLVSIIILFFILTFFFLSMTLVHVSVTQYMTYAAARRLALGNKDIGDEGNQNPLTQKGAANDHYIKLRNQLFSATAHTGKPGDWFAIQEDLGRRPAAGGKTSKSVGDRGPGEGGGYLPQDRENKLKRFYGVTVLFQAKALKLNIPFLTDDPSNFTDVAVASFLGREPSQKDCEKFNSDRAEKINSKYTLEGINIINFREGDNEC